MSKKYGHNKMGKHMFDEETEFGRKNDMERGTNNTNEGNRLEKAINSNNMEEVLTILDDENSDWYEQMKVSDNNYDTPMRKLIRNMPEAARLVFDNCTTSKRTKDGFEVVFDYTFLDDTDDLDNWIPERSNAQKEDPYTNDSDRIKENHPLMIMVTSNRTELLDHPLVSALLKRKWISIGFILSIVNYLIYAIFLTLLTGFTLALNSPHELKSASCTTICECPLVKDQQISAFSASTKYGIFVMAPTVLLIEIIEMKYMYSFKVWNYFLNLENLSEWITSITAIIFVVNISDCDDTGFRPEWQWTCGTISVFLAWINMLIMLQKFEWIGIYVVMLYRIVKVFVKFFLVFSLLVVAFAISFHCIFENQEQFNTVGNSLVKTTAMMIGDIDFGTIFFEEPIHFDFISYGLFYIFMLFMTIVVMNLLVALAVDNIQEFKRNAGLAKRRMQGNTTRYIARLDRKFDKLESSMKTKVAEMIQEQFDA